MTIDLTEPSEPAEPTEPAEPIGRRRRFRLTLVYVALWLTVVFVSLPLLAFGLERTGAIFGFWGDWPELWQRDMWVLAIGTGLLFLCLVIGLCLSVISGRWISGVVFALALAAALATYSAAHRAHPERFQDVIDVVGSVTGTSAPTQPRP